MREICTRGLAKQEWGRAPSDTKWRCAKHFVFLSPPKGCPCALTRVLRVMFDAEGAERPLTVSSSERECPVPVLELKRMSDVRSHPWLCSRFPCSPLYPVVHFPSLGGVASLSAALCTHWNDIPSYRYSCRLCIFNTKSVYDWLTGILVVYLFSTGIYEKASVGKPTVVGR